MTEPIETVASLHDLIVDAREGYKEGAALSDSPEIIALLSDLRDMHAAHAAALATALSARGITPDENGSFLKYVHKAILQIRSAITGLGESILPGLCDGEERILRHYDEALAATTEDAPLHGLLERQRGTVAGKLALMRRMEAAAEV